MGWVQETISELSRDKLYISTFDVLLIVFNLGPVIYALFRFFLFIWPDWKLENFRVKMDRPRRIGQENSKACVLRVHGLITPKPELGPKLGEIHATVVRDEVHPFEVGRFYQIKVEVHSEDSIRDWVDDNLRDTEENKIENWPVLVTHDLYYSLEEEESPEVTRKVNHSVPDRLTSSSHALACGVLGWLAFVLICVPIAEWVSPYWGVFSMFVAVPAVGYMLPEGIWWLKRRRNPLYGDDEPYRYVARPLPKQRQPVQGLVVQYRDLPRSDADLSELPPEVSIQSLLAGRPRPELVESRIDVAALRLAEEAAAEDLPPSPHDGPQPPETVTVKDPVVSAEALMCAARLHFRGLGAKAELKRREGRTRRLVGKKFTKEWVLKLDQGKDTRRELKGELRLKVHVTYWELEWRWKAKERKEGEEETPRPLDDSALDLEVQYFADCAEELRALELACRPGVPKTLTALVAAARGRWTTQAWRNVPSYLRTWAYLGTEVPDEGGDQQEDQQQLELAEGSTPVPHQPAKQPQTQPGAAKADVLEKLTDIMGLLEMSVEHHQGKREIVQVDMLSPDGHILWFQKNLGTPYLAATSAYGFNDLQEKLTLANYRLARAMAAKDRQTVEHTRESAEMTTRYYQVDRDVRRILGRAIPQIAEYRDATVGVTFSKDFDARMARHDPGLPGAAKSRELYGELARMPVSEELAKALRKHAPVLTSILQDEARRPGLSVVLVQGASE